MINPLLCDVCGRNMTTKNGRRQLIGRSVVLDDHEGVVSELYPELAGCKWFTVCLVCWLRSMGIKIARMP
jgi:hypothetical protein